VELLLLPLKKFFVYHIVSDFRKILRMR